MAYRTNSLKTQPGNWISKIHVPGELARSAMEELIVEDAEGR